MTQAAFTLSSIIVLLLGMLIWNMARQRHRTRKTERIGRGITLTPLEPDRRGEELSERLEKVAEKAIVRRRSIEEQMRVLRTGRRD